METNERAWQPVLHGMGASSVGAWMRRREKEEKKKGEKKRRFGDKFMLQLVTKWIGF